jgi:choline-glycine betaine transporter
MLLTDAACTLITSVLKKTIKENSIYNILKALILYLSILVLCNLDDMLFSLLKNFNNYAINLVILSTNVSRKNTRIKGMVTN